MKKIITFALTFLILVGQVHAQNFVAPDVLIDTKLSADWSGLLVMKMRRMFKNLNMPDPFRQKFDEPMTVVEDVVDSYLSPSSRELLTELGHILNMDLLNGKTQVTLHGLRYDVRQFKTDIRATDENINGISLGTDFSASSIRLSADKVRLSLVMQGKNALPAIDIDIVKPSLSAKGDRLINFFAQIQLLSKKDKYQLFLEHANFESMAQGLLTSNGINLDLGSIVVPTVKIRVGNKVLEFDPAKIEALIKSKQGAIKEILLAQAATMLTSGFGADALKAMNDISFAKEHWFTSSYVESMMNMKSFENFTTDNHMLVTMEGNFCIPERYKTYGKECIAHKITQPRPSRLTPADNKASLDNIRDQINQGDANIVVSISEDYINKLLATTFDAKLWDDILKDAGVVFGANKAFIRLDEKGSGQAILYMDLLYTPKKIESLAIGEKQVRFPLALKVSLKIKAEKFVPIFVISIDDVDTSDEMLLYGNKEIGVESNIHKLRMKKKVLATVRSQMKSISNKEVLSLKYPELRGLGLDKVDFVSDGHGRMNALMLLKDASTENKTSSEFFY